MRVAPIALTAVLAALAAAAPASAATATCSHPASDYSTGAPPDVGAGPQPVNDPIFPDQWGLAMIKAPAAWARGVRGAGATIAVVDTGVDLAHPDLRANLTAGADLTPAAAQGCPGPQDEDGHGTHVAGIAAAVTNNGIGVAGTAPDARLMPVRVLDASGAGDDSTVIAGIRWAADHGASVINLSLGGMQVVGETPQLNEDLAKAVDYAWAKGAVVVAAAGNETIPLCSYPAAAEHAVCVGAVDRRGLPSAYSNFPDSTTGAVGVRAPGGVGDPVGCEDSEDVWSTIWPEGDPCRDTAAGELSGYDTLAGTSMAAPFVSGVAALLAGKGLSNAQIVDCLRRTSSNGGSFDPVMGYGIVDADAAARTCSAASAPGAGGGGTSAASLSVTVRRVSRARLARTRRLHVSIRNGRAMTVRLRALVRSSPRARWRTGASRRVKCARAGRRSVTLRLGPGAARRLRHRHASFRVLYSGGGQRGVARVR